LLKQLKDKKDLQILDKPSKNWKVKENKLWLEIRGLSTDGKASELKDRVDDYLKMNVQPPIITTESESIDDILTLIDLLTEVIGTLMSKATLYDEINYIELLIRKFLNYYNKVDKEVARIDDSPTWMTQYNFLCLLNIPSIMRKFGCCRNIWEGGIEGEGFLRKYKRELQNGIKYKWQIWTINNLLQRHVFNKEKLETKRKWKHTLSLLCRIYNSNITINNIITEGKPISGVYIDGRKEIIISFRENNIIKGIRIQIDWLTYEWYCNMKYFNIEQTNEKLNINKELVNKSIGCLLLPRLNKSCLNVPLQYCIVFSDWRKI
jgi:hypothetical protein